MNKTHLVQDFLAENQSKINKRLSNFILAFLILCPALLLANTAELMHFNVPELVGLCGLIVILSVLPAIFVRLCPYDAWNRCICLTSFEFLICLISCNGILEMNVLFVVVPIVSLLYVKRSIFLHTATICFFVMLMLNVGVLRFKNATAASEGALLQTGYQVLIELVVEYLIIMIILYFACNRMYEIVAFGYNAEQQVMDAPQQQMAVGDGISEETREKSYDIKGLFLEVDQTIDRLIRGKGKKHILMVDYDLPVRLKGDSEKVKSIMIQMLSDLVQFTEKGEVEIEVTYEKGIAPKKGQNITVVCTISCPENLTQQMEQGKALGFARAEKMLQELDGVVLDESGGEPYRTGYVVSFQQIVDSEETIRQVKQRHRQEQKKLILDSQKKVQNIFYAKEVKVLVVDDSYVNQKLIRAILKDHGMRAVCVSSGEEAIEKVKTKAFDFVILDHMMPVKGGIQIAKEIRQLGEPYFEMLPMMAMTSNMTKEAKQVFYDNGFTEVISKPIKEEEMRQAIAHCMFL